MGFLNIVSMDESGVTVTPFDQISDDVRTDIVLALITGQVTVFDPATGKECK
jgi:hypothetical protein